MALRHRLALSAFLVFLVSLSGCGVGPHPGAGNVGALPTVTLSGKVHGGQQPVAGATVQLYTVGTSADGSASTPLLTQTVTSDSGGGFTLTHLYSCTNATLVYVTATGGNPGGYSPNPNLALMTALGPCSGLTASTYISINEVTTVAAVSALAPYMSSATSIGSSATDLSNLTNAFILASEYANPVGGTSPGTGAPAGTTIPSNLINTLANVVAACVNSSGGVSGDGSICGQLFSLTTPGSSPAPTNTIAALLYLAGNPTLNTALLYVLQPSAVPFMPNLSASPTDFRIRPVPVNTSALTITPSVLTFPTGTVGTASSPQLVTISNPTGAAVAISSITFTGANQADFSQTNNCPGSLSTNGSCNVLVTITPSAAGARIGYLAVTNSTPASPQYATLTLNNIAPTLTSLNPNNVTAGATTSTDILLIGSNFLPTSTAQVGGTSRPTTYFSSTELVAQLTVADQAKAGSLSITVVNPPPGGGVSGALSLTLIGPPAAPVISQLLPATFTAGSGNTYIDALGANLTATTVLQWNGTALTTSEYYSPYNGYYLAATVPGTLLASSGTATVTAYNPTASPTTSNAVTVTINNPPQPTLTSLSPTAGPINTATAVTLYGSGFAATSTVAVNGLTIPSTFVSSTELTATFPAASVATPGNYSVTVTTPAPGGGTTAAQLYTTYLSLANNDLVYNATDGMLYASVPASSVGSPGNAVVAIDPFTGLIKRQIAVGTNPNKLALSSDGTQLFVGIDGAASVAQINLASGVIVSQFSLGGGPGVYNPPYTAAYLAAVPGSPNSVAVASAGSFLGGSGVAIYDSGVERPKTSSTVGEGPLSFGTSASTLYMAGSSLEALTAGSTGITGAQPLYSPGGVSTLQYDNGQLYLSSGAVVNASTGALSGTFYSAASTVANGPIVSDSTLGEAFIASTNYSGSGAIYAFSESTFNLLGSIPVNGVGTAGYPTNFRKIVRWGQNGVAVAAVPSAFTSNNQIFIFQSPLVSNLSSLPSDLSVSLSTAGATSTGAPVNWVAAINNAGPNPASGTTLSFSLDPSLMVGSITPSQGSCTAGASILCDLGTLANGIGATVTVSVTPTTSGTYAGSAYVTSSSYDPNLTNNQTTTSSTVTGSFYGSVPTISAVSPSLVQASSANTTLTVTGTGFNASSTVYLGSTALATTYISATSVSAIATATTLANYGWAPVTVSNPAPGGGVSGVLPLTIYALVNVPANAIAYDPFGQSLYATIPGSATSLVGNSLVKINPYTGAVGTPVAVGSQPTVMAETADGNDLYISLSGSDSLAQYDLVHQSLAQTIAFSGAPSSAAATALAVLPGTDNTLAVNFSGTDAIMDITGSVGTLRPNFGGNSFPTFGNATTLYTYDNYSTGAEFYRYNITSSGLTLIDGTTLDGMGGFSGGFGIGSGLIYGAAGGIINPLTTPPSQVQTLPLVDFYGSGDVGGGVLATPDPSLQKDFLMLENTAGTWAYGLIRYDLKTYLPEAQLLMPASASGVESNWTVLRFGQDGLTLLSNNTINTPAVSQLILLRGPFVAPQELGTAAPASLTASSATTIAHGSGNTTLTLTGSNLLPGVAVTWNGSYRTTTIVDATHVTIAIPASDLAQSGSATVVATNPGAGASNALQITID